MRLFNSCGVLAVMFLTTTPCWASSWLNAGFLLRTGPYLALAVLLLLSFFWRDAEDA